MRARLTDTRCGHFEQRADERHLRSDVLDFILIYGSEIRAAGATHLTVHRRCLPAEVRDSDIARRSHDWIVVIADDGVALTCYRRWSAARFLKHKPKRRLSDAQLLRAA